MVQLDLEKIKQRLEQLKDPKAKYGGGTKGPSLYWKPKADGSTSTIRLVKYPYSEDPYLEKWFHYGLGKQGKDSVLCPQRNKQEKCPVCDFSYKLFKEGNAADKETAKQLMAKQRFYAVIVDRDDKTLTPKYWGFGVTVFGTLLTKLTSKQTQHYLDPENGIDLEVNLDKSSGKKFPDTNLDFVRNDSPLGSKEEIARVMSAVKPFEEVFKETPLIEIKQKLSEWVNRGQEEKTDEQLNESKEVSRGASSDDDLEEELKNAGVGTVEEQFEAALKSKRV